MDYYRFTKQYGKKRIPEVGRLMDAVRQTYERITVAGASREHLRPSEEWIADNYYMIREFSRQFRKTVGRRHRKAKHQAYLIALFIIRNTDGQTTRDNIIRYADRYEAYQALTMPALGYFPEMLRLALLEQLAALCDQTEYLAREHERAENLFAQYKILTGEDAPISPGALDLLFNRVGEITPAFADSLLKIAAGVTLDTTALRNGLTKRLAGGGQTLQQLIETAHQTQIRLGTDTGNCIRSLSELRDLCMDEILARLNRVEQILSRDPAGVFTRMSRDTKDAYIRCVYLSAKHKKMRPVDEALRIVDRATADQCHVGEVIPGLVPEPQSAKPNLAITLWMMGLGAVVPVIGPALFLLGVLAGEIYRCIRTRHLPVRVMPSMDFGGVIPEHIRVMLVIPGLLSDEMRGPELLHQLACMVPAGKSDNLYCALIGDLPEGKDPTADHDAACIQRAEAACAAFNQGISPHFFTYIRPRTFCQTEGTYSGRERKRGALLDFGAYLEAETAQGRMPKIDYIITVDADSILTYSAMVRLVEQMAHPLNTPVVADTGGLPVVRRGHGIIAPAASIFSSDREITPFARVMGGENGFSGYAGRTSEYYYDKTGCGIYSGKGIYIPDLYRLLLEEPFAPETLLSHDLIEGAFLHAGFASEVRLYETFPRDPLSYLKRMHRWIRGDWQLLPYMKKTFRDRKGILRQNPLSGTYLTMMQGNLKSSAAPVFALLLLGGGCVLAPEFWWLWLPLFFLYTGREWVMNPGRESLLRSGMEFLWMPEKAYRSGDAILRTVYRVFYSKKHLLSWVTARDAERKSSKTVSGYYRQMWPTILLALAMLLLSWCVPLGGAIVLLAMGLFWLAAPAFFYSLGKPERKQGQRVSALSLSKRERTELMVMARKIWAYYEDYAVAGDHDLPPDNVQLKPVYGVAHRTSPTNIGYLILSTAIAAEFGYISLQTAVMRLGRVMDTLAHMETLEGHLLNWYDTTSLTPLEPRFVSSVDSGNLVACMLAACGILADLNDRLTNATVRDRVVHDFQGLEALCACVSETAAEDGRIRRNTLTSFADQTEGDTLSPADLEAQWCLLLDVCQEQAAPRTENTDAALYRDKLLTFCRERRTLAQPCGETKPLIARMKHFCMQMNFSFLFRREKGLFSIGWHVGEGKLSEAHYDIYVSEARLMSAVAAAKGDVPEEHFTRMTRRRGAGGRGILQSWSGTAFEYLMPDLFLEAPEGSLWDETANMMLAIQIREGQKNGTPWGVSESCYNVMDLNMNYKYKAFGVPGLSVHGKEDGNCVVAPYASMMALPRIPKAVLQNLRSFRNKGAWGRYGYYEAVDYTKGRKGIVYCYMAHHLGMSLCGIANLVCDHLVAAGLQRGAGMSALRIYAQERKPKGYGRYLGDNAPVSGHRPGKMGKKTDCPPAEMPESIPFSGSSGGINLLSNGRYTVVTDDAGCGMSRMGDLFLTKYEIRASLNRGCGVHLYVGQSQTERIQEGVFYPEKTVYKRSTEVGCAEEAVCVSAEDDTEIRLLHFTEGTGTGTCVTAFAEIILNTLAAYQAHPSFSDLFVTTAALYDRDRFLGLVASRKPREPEEASQYAFFGLYTDGSDTMPVEYDTDLCAVYGRNNDSGVPDAVRQGKPLTGAVGAPVTPCFAIRRRLDTNTKYAWLCTGFAGSLQDCRGRLLKYRELACAKGAFELARTRTLVEREYIGLKPGEWHYFTDLSGSLLRFDGQKRPLVTVMMRRMENSNALEKMVRFWCMMSFRGFPVDLVIVAFDDGAYLSPIRELADQLAGRALSGAFGCHGELVVMVPADGKNVQPLIADSHLVFWM